MGARARANFRNPQIYPQIYPQIHHHAAQGMSVRRRNGSRVLPIKIHKRVQALFKQHEDILAAMTATIFTGAIFLAGFYLFCAQLAESGW